MIAFLIALGTSLLWYLFDRQRENKQPANQFIGHYRGIIRKGSLDAYKRKFYEKQPDEKSLQKPLGRVYYSTPGRTYKRFIQDGRILNIGKTWPYPPNTP